MKQYTLFLLSMLLLSACVGNKQSSDSSSQTIERTYTVEYAKGFTVKIYADYKEIMVVDPWDTTRVLQRYILVDKNIDLPANLPEGTIVRTPLERVVAYSTIHCATLDEIGVLNTVIGVCEPEYIDVDYVKEGIKSGAIANLGQADNPVIEKIIDIHPEVIFATPIKGQTYGSIDKTKIPVIETPDYMEPLPLGRAEWVRFYSLFFDNEAKVDSLYQNTVTNYNSIKEKISTVTHKPTVFMDLMYGNVWYIQGGESFMARMLSDAGANYVWANNDEVDVTPSSFEQVLDKAGEADFWLIKYNQPNEMTYRSLANEYKPYSYFTAYKKRNVYACNAGTQSYYEDLPIHPDYILLDFAAVFHPHLFPDYKSRYYSKMQE